MIKVSVIIPVYNVKTYLERCVQSVTSQTFKDMEIVMVDDGSTDGSGELADQLATCDERIHIIHQKNQGLSGARNTGIRAAKGEYIVFLDSDDEWLLTDGIETLIRESKKNADLIVFKRVDIWKHGHRDVAADYDIVTIAGLPDASEIFAYLVKMQRFQMSACFLMIRRSIIVDNKIYFPIGQVDEDISWSLHLWQVAQTVSFHNLPFYGYYHRAESITTSFSIRQFRSNDYIFTHWKELCRDECVNRASILSYLANIWVSLGYHFQTLKDAEKPEAISIMIRHKDLLQYAMTPKTRRTAILVTALGVKGATWLLGFYWQLRSRIKGNKV